MDEETIRGHLQDMARNDFITEYHHPDPKAPAPAEVTKEPAKRVLFHPLSICPCVKVSHFSRLDRRQPKRPRSKTRPSPVPPSPRPTAPFHWFDLTAFSSFFFFLLCFSLLPSTNFFFFRQETFTGPSTPIATSSRSSTNPALPWSQRESIPRLEIS